jgi:hypothetical protein
MEEFANEIKVRLLFILPSLAELAYAYFDGEKRSTSPRRWL